MKTWKHNIAIIILFGILMGVLLMAFDNHAKDVKGLLFFLLLSIASYIDIKTRTIPNVIHILIMMVGLIQIDPVDSLLGFFLVPLPFFIMAYLKEGSIGGGDVKLISAYGFNCGIIIGTGAVILALFSLLVIVSIYNFDNIITNKKTPLSPFVFCGYFVIFVLGLNR